MHLAVQLCAWGSSCCDAMNGHPDVNDGFMKTATELQGALCRFRIPGEARQVLDAILLKTYGFNKKEDCISLSQFAGMTGLSTSEVCRAVRKLLAMNVIGKKESGGMNCWHVNKHYATWRVLAKKPVAKKILSKKIQGTGEKDNQVLAKKTDTIDTLTKDILQKTSSPSGKGPRPCVETVMNGFKKLFPMDGSERSNRRYAWLLIQKAMKDRIGTTEDEAARAAVALLEHASLHEWWAPRITSLETVYRKANMIANAVRESKKTHIAFIS